MTVKSLLPDLELIAKEVKYTSSRSGGAGGQNVNKVNSKVRLEWNLMESFILTPEQRDIILRKLASRINSEGQLTIFSQESQSQFQNKKEALLRLNELLVKAFHVTKTRKATKPSKGAHKARVESKRKLSEKKQWRGKIL